MVPFQGTGTLFNTGIVIYQRHRGKVELPRRLLSRNSQGPIIDVPAIVEDECSPLGVLSTLNVFHFRPCNLVYDIQKLEGSCSCNI